MRNVFLFIAFFSFVHSMLFAHPGRTDRNGGHNGPNGYHYHGGSGTTQRSTVTPAPQEVTTSLYEGNNFQNALDAFLSACDSLERELPYFQSLGIGDEKSIKRSYRYYVYKTTRFNTTVIRFNDLTQEKRVTLVFAGNNNSFSNTGYRIFQYPNVGSRESANNYMMEMRQ